MNNSFLTLQYLLYGDMVAWEIGFENGYALPWPPTRQLETTAGTMT